MCLLFWNFFQPSPEIFLTETRLYCQNVLRFLSRNSLVLKEELKKNVLYNQEILEKSGRWSVQE